MWKYQATHRTVRGEDVFEVREVFPAWGERGETLWTQEAVAAFGETKDELIECLRMMLADVLEFAVLDLDEVDETDQLRELE